MVLLYVPVAAAWLVRWVVFRLCEELKRAF